MIASPRKYRFGFVLSTSLGNLTRYQNLRKFAERDPDVEFVWAPVKHYFGPDEHDPFRRLPGPVRSRAIVLHQAAPVLQQMGRLDAVMIHLYEVDILTALRGLLFKTPLRVVSSDGAPAVDPSNYPFHPVELKKTAMRRALRLRIDLWCARQADLLVPFSTWAGNLLVNGAGVPPERVVPIHVGLDLDIWRCEPRPPALPNERVKLLFVGGDFERKGGQTLLKAFERHLSDCAELHLVTKSAPSRLPKHVHVYSDMQVNDARLAQLYRRVDILVHPTRSDLSSWVVLEAMASGCPAVTTAVGGIVDLVQPGRTGIFVQVDDPDALAAAIRPLIDDPERRRLMGEQARAFVEQHFDAAVNVPRILALMKRVVDQRRGAPGLAPAGAPE